MSNTVFVLGAGASKLAGAPLMKEFLDTAYELWRSGKFEGPEELRFKTVFDARAALQAVHSKSELDLDNIESVFTTCEMAKTLNRFPGKKGAEIDDLIRALKFVIVQTLERTVRFPCAHPNLLSPPPYDQFAKLIQHLRDGTAPPDTVSVITFNYDIAADFALFRNGFATDYGLGVNSQTSADSIPLLKLHGSLNWTETIPSVEPRTVVPWTMEEFWGPFRLQHPEHKYLLVPIGSRLSELSSKQNNQVTGEAVLVPPTWNKAETHRSLSMVWQRAASALSQAENIFVVGYSMPETDVFFRYLYALGTVGPTMLKRFWVFDPDKTDSVRKRFSALLGPGAKARFQYFEKDFSEAIPILTETFPKHRRS